MPKTINAAALGVLVRDARTAAGLSQTDLANRIGASRFWVAEFEKGKPSAALGLALEALHALGLALRIEPHTESPRAQPNDAGLGNIIAHTTLARTAPSSVVGWPTASTAPRRSRKP